jgi:hypothetical protein
MKRRRNIFKSGQREKDFVSEAVNRRGVHLESEEKSLEKCGIVEGVVGGVT